MNAAWVLCLTGAAVMGRAILGRFHCSYGRGRGFFEQCIFRACWFFLSLLLFLTFLTRPASLPIWMVEADLTIFSFLCLCGFILELLPLFIYRSRILGEILICKTDRFGTIRFPSDKLDVIFTMKTGPQGLSSQAWLVPIHRGIPSPIPRLLVYQVLIRTRETYPFKYLLVGEALRRGPAEALASQISQGLEIATLPERLQESSRLKLEGDKEAKTA